MTLISTPEVFYWDDLLDNGTDVVVHAYDYEPGDESVGMQEAFAGLDVRLDTGTDEEGDRVEISPAEEERFQKVACEKYHADDAFVPEPADDLYPDEPPY